MKKIITVLGARPQFIKAAVVSRHIARTPGLSECIIHTGQHFDTNMSDIFFEEMDIPKPVHNLNINGLGHGAMTGQMLEKVEAILMAERPDVVLVYGDTNSTLAGALAARKMNIMLAHVESGLRSYNMQMPEEVNRILTDRISDLLFCPTKAAVKNLENEGSATYGKILNTGDVMLDAAIYYSNKSKKPAIELPKSYVLCTIHRSENTNSDAILRGIMAAIEIIARQEAVVLPIHPRTKARLNQLGYALDIKGLYVIDPVSYFEMIHMLRTCTIVMTDSGGLQKEAYFFKKQCLIIREETEWLELVEHGYNTICGTETANIVNEYNSVKGGVPLNFDDNLYGNGKAGELIVEYIAAS